MNAYKRIELGPEAIEYVREQLAYGSSLGRCLLQGKDLDKGSVIIFLPSDVSPVEAGKFEAGGKVKSLGPTRFSVQDGPKYRMVPKGSSYPQLAALLVRFLDGASDRLCIVEETLMRPSDPGVSDVDPRMVRTLGDEVYYLLTGVDVDETATQNLIRKATTSWHFVCAMTSTPARGLDCQNGPEITQDEMKVLADRAASIVVGAYDGEGYLVWSEEGGSNLAM